MQSHIDNIHHSHGQKQGYPHLTSLLFLNDDYEGGGFITKDGKVLIFSSDRRGGIGAHKQKVGVKWGNQDIYISHNSGNNTWSEPVNLGDVINTPGAEVTPFMSSDEMTLYFSSNGHPGLGRTDVFRSRRDNKNSWKDWFPMIQ